MKCTADLRVEEDPANITSLLEETQRDRSQVKITAQEGFVQIHVEAQDAVAFRATLTGILQALSVYETMKKTK